MQNFPHTSYLEDVITKSLTQNEQQILISKREGVFSKAVEDNNLFFTLSAWLILKDTSFTQLTEALRRSVERNLESYRNKDGRSSFNFWRTSPYEQWPNHSLFSKQKKFWVPDDLDCTTLSHFFLPSNSIEQLRNEISRFFIQTGESTGYYTTWFGQRMPHEFDICACANYLLLLRSKSIEFNDKDSALLNYIVNQIRKKKIADSPFELSPNYQTLPIILFHLSRLFSTLENEHSKEMSEQLILSIERQFNTSVSTADKILLSIALSQLGVPMPNRILLNLDEMVKFTNEFSFFSAPILYSAKSAVVRSFGKRNRFNLKFISPGFNAALLLKNYCHLE